MAVRGIAKTRNSLGRLVPEVHCPNFQLLAARTICCASSPSRCFVAVSGSLTQGIPGVEEWPRCRIPVRGHQYDLFQRAWRMLNDLCVLCCPHLGVYGCPLRDVCHSILVDRMLRLFLFLCCDGMCGGLDVLYHLSCLKSAFGFDAPDNWGQTSERVTLFVKIHHVLVCACVPMHGGGCHR